MKLSKEETPGKNSIGVGFVQQLSSIHTSFMKGKIIQTMLLL